jgi:hypothetical protein
MSTESHFTRRHFLTQQAFGLGGLALAWLLQHDRALAVPAKPALEPATFDLKAKLPAAPPQARAMISMFMQGGPSHLDLFDPKPELMKRDGQKYEGDIKYDNAAESSAKLLAPKWKFAPRGQCGTSRSRPGAAERPGVGVAGRLRRGCRFAFPPHCRFLKG